MNGIEDCTCAAGFRCAKADRLWDVRAKAKERMVRGAWLLFRALDYLRADRAWNRHITGAFKEALNEVR